MTLLSIEGVTVRRGGRTIVDGVNAELAAGQFVALIGANGAGKSSLLKAAAGLWKPDAGQVTLDGALLASLSRRTLAQRRAYLPQSPRVEWPISVERLVALGLTPRLPPFGGLDAWLEPALTQVIEACDLTAHRHQTATTLSGGELARAMLARALIGEPDILLVDEPISGLDPRHALDTVSRLQALALGSGRLVLAAIHDLTLAARYSTHILALHEGRLATFGPTAQVLTPALLRQVFQVDARISGQGLETVVHYSA